MLDSLFRPGSVAVVGASTKSHSLGNRIIKNLQEFGFRGPIYPINPKADEILGLKVFPSIEAMPERVDVVHMVIPARFVPQSVEACGLKGVKNIIINSGGFSETGPEGEAFENQFMATARKYGIRILGPNCQGIINSDPDVRAYCNFTLTKSDPGVISIVALSGGVAEVIHQRFFQMDVGTRLYASNGNAVDISIPEIIRYMGNDPGTKLIVTYVEGLRDAQRFLEVAGKVASKKPLLAMKAGRTQEGAKAAASHTGGLAKTDLVTDLIFKKAGVLVFSDEGELCNAALAISSQPVPRGNRIGIITNTGGPAVIATDVLAGAGLEIPELSSGARQRLSEVLFPEASIRNPIDTLATATAPQFRECLQTLMDEDTIDAIYINFVTPFFIDTEQVAREIVDAGKAKRKPIVCNLITDKAVGANIADILRSGSIPCFSLPGEAARAMIALVRRHEVESRDSGEVIIFNDVDHNRVSNIIQGALAAGRQQLLADEVYGILSAYGIPTAEYAIAGTAADVVSEAEKIGYPVVVKIDSESVIHKSDSDGVALNLTDGDQVTAAVAAMKDRLGNGDLRFLVQKYLPRGKELIIGAKHEEPAHLIMFGLGGVYVEVLKDVAFGLAPVTTTDAVEMVRSLKGFEILKGVRGERGVNLPFVYMLIQRISQLVSDFPQIREMDLNPVLATEKSLTTVDARITVG